MDNLVIGFIVGIVGNIFASYIYDRLRSQNSRTPPLILIAKPTTLPSKPKINSTGELDNRAMNRERARRLFALLLFFTSTFLIFLGALQLPIFLIIPEAHTLNLGQIKLIGLFTGAIVSISSVRNFMTIAAIVLYLPLLLFGDRLLVTYTPMVCHVLGTDFRILAHVKIWYLVLFIVSDIWSSDLRNY
jgi:hypothetical protein